MSTAGVLLIHGLGGTPCDLGQMNKRLTHKQFDVHSVVLPGHGGKPEDLIEVRMEDWLACVHRTYQELKRSYKVLHVVGMSMGALLAIELMKRERAATGKLVALAPPVFIDGWAVPWYHALRHVLYRIPFVSRRIKIHEADPYGVKNTQLRAIIRARLRRGESFHYDWVPLASLREFDRLRTMVRSNLHRIHCDSLIVHSREDELTSTRSTSYLMTSMGSEAQSVLLENSYHMICVDNDRELVAESVGAFLAK